MTRTSACARVEQRDFALVDLQPALLLEARQQAADAFDGQPQVVADVLARHAQLERHRRIAARRVARRQVDQEYRKPLLGTHVPQQEHHVLLARDLLAHDAVEVAQQRRHVAEQFLQPRERDLAYLAVFQRHRVAVVPVAADRVHPQQLAGHLEAGDLRFAGGIDLVGLEVAEAHRVQVAERLAHLVQPFVALEAAAAADDLVEPVDIGVLQPHRQA
jgi:hypothetical protein